MKPEKSFRRLYLCTKNFATVIEFDMKNKYANNIHSFIRQISFQSAESKKKKKKRSSVIIRKIFLSLSKFNQPN